MQKPGDPGKPVDRPLEEAVGVRSAKSEFINIGPSSCVIKLEGKLRYRALIDTGAEVSLVSKRVYDALTFKSEIVRKKLHLQSVSGQALDVLGETTLKFKMGGLDLVHNFIVVSEMNRNVILGRDWMNANQVRIYFDLRKIRVGGCYVPFEEDIHVASLVRLKKTQVLKPHSISLVAGKLKRKPYFEKVELLQFSSAELDRGYVAEEPGLGLDDVLAVLNSKDELPVSVANHTNKTITLRRGCLLGKVESVKESCVVDGQLEEKVLHREGKLLEQLSVPSQYREDVERLVMRNNDVFAISDLELGRTSTVEMEIDTGDNSPIKLRPYRTPLQSREIVEKAVNDMLASKVIERGHSEWSCPVVLVTKKDGSVRFCCDYRKLNAVTKSTTYPLPNIDDILSTMTGANYFTTLDCRSGYWAIPLSEDAKKKSTFSCHLGSFKWNVMPFGLKNAPSKFMQLMDIVLHDMRNYCSCFIDDIVVYSKTFEEHIMHLQTVFDRLRQHKLKLKMQKCHFVQAETEYLGFIITNKGIKPNPEKVQAIRNLQPPVNVRQTRGFLGMINFYRRYVPNFSEIARPIIDLTKKYSRFKWTDECQRAFDFLKESLGAVPLLAFPDRTKPYILYTDSSDYAIGAALVQEMAEEEDFESVPGCKNEKPIHFISKKLSKSQSKWPIIEKECFAIFYAVQKLDFYLHNAKFTVRTDHRPLKFLLESPMQNRKVQSWALSIAGYDCTIEYIEGKNNVIADLLSRSPPDKDDGNETDLVPEVNDYALQVNVINSNEFQPKEFARGVPPVSEETPRPTLEGFDIVKEQSLDAELVEVANKLRNEVADKSTYRHFMVIDEVLYFISGSDDEPNLRLYVPMQLRKHVLEQYHDSNGHMGTTKVYTAIKVNYYWPNLFKDVYSHVEKCVTCNSRYLKTVKVPLQHTDVPPYPFAKISVDVSGPYPKTLSGNLYIVTFVDHYSLWPESFPTPDKTSQTVANLLIEEIIPRFGCPLEIVSDNGPENIGQAMQETLKELNIHHVLTTFYHPEGNAKNERQHRTLNDLLSKQVGKNPVSWDLFLNSVLGAIRTNVNESTQFSPYYLLYARHPVLPLDNILRPRLVYHGEDRHALALQEQHRAFTLVHRNFKRAQDRQKKYADKKAKEVCYDVGDSVYYKNNAMKSKLDEKWRSHYIILDVLSPVTYLLKNQLTGATVKAHAKNIRYAKLNWEDPKPDESTRPRRGAAYVCPPEVEQMDSRESSSDEEMEKAKPIDRFIRDKVRERENSSSEDDIPLMELKNRLARRNETCKSSSETVTEDGAGEPMLVDYVKKRKVKRRKHESSVLKIKRLLNAVTSIL